MSTPAPSSQSPVQDIRAAFHPAAMDRPVVPGHIAPSLETISSEIPCAGCGYILKGLSAGALCPECARPAMASVNGQGGATPSSVHRRWAALVAIGLVSMLLLCPSQIWVALEMRFAGGAFGSAPRLNVPGPKVWATPLVQRSIGYRPEWLGVQGTWLTLLGLAAVFLVTSPRVDFDAGTDRLRLATRWLPAVLVGGYFGFLLNTEHLYDSDVAVGKYAMIGVGGVEVPCSLLFLLYLARLAKTLGQSRLARDCRLVAAAQLFCMVGGIGMAILAEDLFDYRKGIAIQSWSALYEAACVVTALLIIGIVIRFVVEMLKWVIPASVLAKFR